jgi:hypothetical protein
MSRNDTGNPPICTSYAEFWPFYLQQHSQRAARQLHIVGTFLALLALTKAILSFSLLWLLLAVALGYGFAWLAHMWIEKNRPATFAYPLWSLRGDFHMFGLWMTGRLEVELLKHDIFT